MRSSDTVFELGATAVSYEVSTLTNMYMYLFMHSANNKSWYIELGLALYAWNKVERICLDHK